MNNKELGDVSKLLGAKYTAKKKRLISKTLKQYNITTVDELENSVRFVPSKIDGTGYHEIVSNILSSIGEKKNKNVIKESNVIEESVEELKTNAN